MANSCIYNKLFGYSLNLKGGKRVPIHNIIQTIYNKKEFLILVFSNLLVQLGITYYVMERTNTKINNWALFAGQIIIIFILALVPMPPFIKFLLFCLFSYSFGLSLSTLKKQYNNQMINIAMQGALSVFALFLALGITLLLVGVQLGAMFGGILFWLLLLLIVARLIFVLGAGLTNLNKMLSFFGIILFAVYVMYDTNIILQRDYYGDFITASMDYYLDILNLFTSILNFNDN